MAGGFLLFPGNLFPFRQIANIGISNSVQHAGGIKAEKRRQFLPFQGLLGCEFIQIIPGYFEKTIKNVSQKP